jgi:hypothetical protein
VTSSQRQERPGGALLSRRAPALLAAAVAFLSAATVASSARAAGHPLRTAIVDPAVFTGPNAAAGLDRARSAGATAIKVPLFWNGVAPARRPAGFRPSNPSDHSYYWAGLDTQLRLIAARGLEPIVYISGPPAWAMRKIDGALRVDPDQYRLFTLAAVKRYSGQTPGLPRVKVWQAWNEPNKVPSPAAKPGVESWYRGLVNEFASAVHTVPGNEVVAGGLSPFGISTAVAPLTFMRDLLCVPPNTTRSEECTSPVHFDIWSVDPYTAGGPSHQTAKPDDISVAGLPKMKAVLDAAIRAGHIVSTRPVQFWVTEFAWDSSPPDPGGVPLPLEGRWVSDAMHRMWQAGISLVTWYTLRDQQLATSAYQSGLYRLGKSFATDVPKPALTAFRFPFTADPAAGGVSIWGRTPTSHPGPVQIEQRTGSGWKQVATVHADSSGIFTGTVHSKGTGPLRATFRAAAATSLAYSLVSPPDRVYQPFGARPAAGSNRASSSAVSQYVEDDPTAGGGLAAGPGIGAVLPAGGKSSNSARHSLPGAVRAAVVGGGMRSALLVAALAAITLVFGAIAVRRRHTGERPA